MTDDTPDGRGYVTISGRQIRLVELVKHSAGRTRSATPPQTAGGDCLRVDHSVGLDANLPVRGDGTLSHQVRDPGIIAGANVGWVRLNFVLGPWNSVWDESVHAGRTWQETYSHIIRGYQESDCVLMD